MPEDTLTIPQRRAKSREEYEAGILERAREAKVPTPVTFAGVGPREQRRQDSERSGLFGNIAELDLTHRAIARRADRQDLRDEGEDPAFSIDPETDLAEIPSTYWSRFVDVKNESEFEWVKDRLTQELEIQQEIGAYGVPGVLARIGVNLFDPVSLAVGVASGGVGWAAKGARLARMMKGGALGASGNAAIETVLAAGSPSLDHYDILLAAGIGGVLGSVGGAITPKAIRDLNKWQRAIEAEEAINTARSRGADVPEPDVDALALNEAGELIPNGRVKQSDLFDEADEDDITQLVDADSTVGAAQTRETRDVGENILENGPSEADLAEVPRENFASWMRLDHAKQTLGNASSAVRYWADGMVMNTVGSRSGRAVKASATEYQRKINKTFLARVNRVINPAFNEWRRANGIRWSSIEGRQQFMSLVGRHIRHGTDNPDPNVQKVIDAQRTFYRDLGTLAHKSGVEGFENFKPDEIYVPRVFDHRAIQNLVENHGTSEIETLIARSMHSKTDIDLADAQVIARGYLERIRRKAHQIDTEAMFGIQVGDSNALREILEQARLSPKQIDEVTNRVEARISARQEKSGQVSFAKRRLLLDESFASDLKVKGSFSQTRRVSIDEMFVNDSEDLMNRYAHGMTGRIALAAKSRIKGPKDLEYALAHIRAHAAKHGQGQDAEKGIRSLQEVYDYLIGKPLDDEYGDTAKAYSRTLRDFNFVRVMNQVGFAQLADLGSLISSQYGRQFLKQIPSFRHLFRSATDGRMTDELAAELEELAGVGTDFINHRMFSRYDDFGVEVQTDGFHRKVDAALHTGKRITNVASGMAPVNTWMQRGAAKAFSQHILEIADGRLKIDAAMRTRLLNLGWDEGMQRRIFAQIQKHGIVENGTLRALRPLEWDDVNARESFSDALHRESTRMIQENDISGTFGFQNKLIGKVMLQFRTFILQAHQRQGLYALNLRDRHSLTLGLMQSFFAGLSFTAQTGLRIAALQAAGNTEAAAKAKEHLKGWNLPKAALQRAAWAGMLPTVMDAGLVHVLGSEHPMFAYRSTGLDIDILTGNPTVDLASSVGRAWGGLARAGQGAQFTQQDAYALIRTLPFQNLLVAGDFLKSAASELPKKRRTGDASTALGQFLHDTRE